MARLKRYSAKQVRRTLGKYDRTETAIEIAVGVELRLTSVEDSYVLLDRLVEQESRLQRVERFPYWAEIWPASIALSRWFHAEKPHIPGGTVLELGCGLGLVGIALARLGWTVEATDFVEDALLFASHNANVNGVTGRHRVGYLDWSNPVGEQCGCIAAADVIYEQKNHAYLGRLLRHLLAPGGVLYTSDPGRQPARRFVEMLCEQGYEHRQHEVETRWKAIQHRVQVHEFHKPGQPQPGSV